MQWKRLWVAGLLTAFLGLASGLPESGGQFPGKGDSTSDPNERFNQYSGGKEVWSRADITDPRGQQRFDFMAQQLGVTNGTISRKQFLEYSQQISERFGGGRSGGPPTMMAAPGGAPAVVSPGGAAPAMPFALPSSSDGRGRSGSGGLSSSSNWGDSSFRRYDRNGDGMLSNDEIPEAMRGDRGRYDTNSNGFIDATEFRSYFDERMQQMQAERGGPPRGSENRGGNQPPGFMEAAAASMHLNQSRGSNDSGRDSMRPSDRGPWGDRSSSGRDDQSGRPVVYQPGNLPRELPSWFLQRDTDRDGQIGVHEWRGSGEPLDQFFQFDANNDGFVTAEEVLRDQAARQRANGNAIAGGGNLGGPDGRSFAFSGNRGGDRGSNGFAGMPGMTPENMTPERFEAMKRMFDGMAQGGGGDMIRQKIMEAMTQGGGDPRQLMEAMMRGAAGSGGSVPNWTGGRTSDGNGSNSGRSFGDRGPWGGQDRGGDGSSRKGMSKGGGPGSGPPSDRNGSNGSDKRGPRRPGGE